MLTSDLLKYTTRKGAVHPHQLKPAAEALCAASLSAIADCEGLELGSAKERLLDAAAASGGQPLIAKGIHKLLLDKCTMEEPGDDIAERRWQWLTAATALRKAGSFEDMEEFHSQLEGATGVPVPEMAAQLFADLPDKRRILAVPSWPAAQLRDRYNIAQIQGLILRAKALTISATFASLGQRRAFFRQLKFQRLVAHVVDGSLGGSASSGGGALKLEVSGPLAIVDSANSYGLRLALFVPWVLALPHFELTATVNLKRSNVLLTLTPDKYKFQHNPYKLKGYVPEELTLFLEAFEEVAAKKASTGKGGAKAKTSKPVTLTVGEDPLVLPGGEQVHADFVARSGSGTKKSAGQELHIELFHKWHKGSFAKRWQYVRDNPKTPLLLGACRSLKKQPEIAALLKNSPIGEEQVLWFTTFPSAKKVWENLASRGF